MDQELLRRDRRDGGQVVPLVLAVMVVVGAVMIALTHLGATATQRARAQTAADAAALAGAAEGRSAAEKLANANGARLVSYRDVGSDVIVTVAVEDVPATARARAGPSDGTVGG